LESLAELDATLIFYESPRRAAAALAAIAEVLPAREVAMTRELTKLYEEVVRGAAAEVAAQMADRELKGEVVLLVGPPARDRQLAIDEEAVRRELAAAVERGSTRKDAVQEVAEKLGIPRNEAYRLSLGGEPR
jgi:16S rRNA (cytidine1402-2'-O)-methyltransferase